MEPYLKVSQITNCTSFFSDNLLGPYTPHPENPVKSGLNGTRSAGNFIVVDGIVYRPTQNCKKEYGESIEINKITGLNEINFMEVPYLTICINRNNRHNCGIHTIHTINVMNNIIAVDGEQWTFSPIHQFKKFVGGLLKSYRLRKEEEKEIQ